MKQKNIRIKDEHDSVIQELFRQYEPDIKEMHKQEGMTGRAGESSIFRMALDIGLPRVAKKLAKLSHN